jgi:hypothetical protein
VSHSLFHLASCHFDERSDEESAFCRRREKSRFLAALGMTDT